MSQRLREFDFLRAFAALSVIAIHLTSGYVNQTAAASYWNEGMRYAVPIFILLSGLVLAYAELNRAPLSYLQFVRKRFGKILVPYLFWSFFYVYYAARDVWRTYGWDGAQRILETMPDHLLDGDGYYHLYFLLIMFELYLLYPLLRAWLNRSPWTLLIASFLLTLTAQTAFYTQHNIWNVYHFPHWIFYFVLGMYIVQYREQLHRLTQGKRVWVLGLAWAASYYLLYTDGTTTGTHYTSIKPTVIIYTLMSFLFFYGVARYVAERATGIFGRFVDWLSANSFLVFLLHPLVLNILDEQALKRGYPHLWDMNQGMVLLFVTVTVLTLVLTWIASYLLGIAWIGGTPARKRKK